MGWSDDQIRLAMMAVRAAGMEDADRYNILRQCGQRAMRDGRPSVKGPGLTDCDFEFFMSLVELECGGQIPLKHKDGTPHGFGEWRDKSNDGPRLRAIYIAGRISGSLLAEGIPAERIIGTAAQAIGGKLDGLDFGPLDERQVRNVIHALRAVAQREGITLKEEVAA
ncbi:MAG: hypothetical protein AAGA29_05760 [Planctomycetota bacterium]